MQQRRWVSYIYRYRDFERCEITGFIKVQRISNKNMDVTRIRMGMKLYKEYACNCYAYLLRKGQAKQFTTLQFSAQERDTTLTSVELPWNSPFGDGVPFPEYEGVFFVCEDGELLAGIWIAEPYDIRNIVVDAPAQTDDGYIQTEEILEGRMPQTMEGMETAETVDVVDKIPQITVPSDNYETMLSTYPKLPLFAGSPIVDGVKISPQDIGKLDMENWKLGVNSFLAHGYYKYQYLMLGKVRMNKSEMCVIGVPGIFTNKERYLANMFGFRVFVPVRKTKIMTGNFGYWISEVVGQSHSERV